MLKTKHAFGLLFVALFAVFAGSVYLLVGSNIDTLLFKQYEQKLKTLDDTLRFGLLEKLNSANIREFAAETRADFIIVHNGGVDFSKNAPNAEFLDENSSEFKSNAEFKGENSSEIYQNNEFIEENSSEFSQNTEFLNEFEDKNSSNAEFKDEFKDDLTFIKQGRAFSSLDSPESLLYSLPNSELFDSNIYEITLKNKKALCKAYNFNGYRYIIAVYPRILELQGYWGKVFAIFGVCVAAFFVLLQAFASKLGASFQKILLFLDKIDKKEALKLDKSPFKELLLLNDRLYKTKNELLKKRNLIKKRNAKIALKSTQLSSVISAISHELKNPLSVIELGVSSLKEQGIDEKTRLLMLNKIHEQCLKLDTLTNKLNFVFNLNEQALQKRHFDILSLCEKISSNPLFERVRLRGKPCEVLADELLIEQVLINLLTNALKYSKKEVRLLVTPLKNAVRISVKDSGIGIEQGKLKLITKKFYKIDSASENSFGIGLFLVKKILALHGSELKIQSKLKKGSEFSFVLPS